MLILFCFQGGNGIYDVKNIRLRGKRTNLLNNSNNEIIVSAEKSVPSYKASTSKTISQGFFYGIYSIYACLFFVHVYLEQHHLPKPLLTEDALQHPNEFIAERAMTRLIKLTNIGPRVAGSYENEVLAVNLLKKEITKIIENSNPNQLIELDIQSYSGSFPLKFLDGLTNVYRNVKDVIVKLSPIKSSRDSLLLNCHFDSVPDSPGGSDDGAGCVVLLEILEVLSKSKEQLESNIIFLFNGAEENLMHGSHGFITQHPWAKEVRAFVNLEACGAGGKEVLFQSGPNSPWIMEVLILYIFKFIKFSSFFSVD